MADVSYTYSPVDGDTLDPNQLDGNLYDTTPSVSIYETSNGKIELANFASSFRVRSYHIQPGQTGLGGFAGALFSSDYFQDAWGYEEVFKPVAGCCLTFHQPYDCNLALFFASFFASVWRQPGPISGGAGTWTTAPTIAVRMFFNGAAVSNAVRALPQTVFYEAGVLPALTLHTVESRTTRHMNLLHARMAGQPSPNQQLTAGEHSFGIGLYVSHNTEGSDTTDANDDKDIGAGPPAYINAMHRVRMFVRNAGWVTFR